MRRVGPALAVCAALVVPALTADAQSNVATYKPCSGKPSAADEKAARGLFDAGRTSYEEADYPRAIQYWRDAFDRDCTANLLLVNLANAYERAGNVDAAVVSLETYLKRAPTAADAPTIQKRLDNMKKSHAATTATASATAAATTAPTATATAPATSASTTPETPPPTASKGPGVLPWVVAGVGGAVAITGVVIYLGGSSKVSDAESICPNRKSCLDNGAREKGNSGRTQQNIGGALGVAGLVVAGVGVAWGLGAFGGSSDKAARSYLVPNVGSGYGGLLAGGSFLASRKARARRARGVPSRRAAPSHRVRAGVRLRCERTKRLRASRLRLARIVTPSAVVAS
jgi:hypothetical protein